MTTAPFRTLGLAGAFLAAGLVAPASAALVTTETVQIDGKSFPAIAVYGEMEPGDGNKFDEVVAETPDAVIVRLHSPGGDLMAGLAIGRAIRARGYATLVMKGDECASACGFAWLAGAPRYMAANGTIGFHGAYYDEGDQSVTSGPGNALVGAYVAQLGLSTDAIVYTTEALPDDMRWLTFNDAQEVGIELVRIGGADAGTETRTAAGKADVNTFSIGTGGGYSSAALADLAEDAVAAAQSYFSASGEENAEAIRFLSRAYAPKVTYYGETLSRDAVISDKIAFVRRWSERRYTIPKNSVEADCDGAGACSVEGVYEWWAYSADRDATTAGRGNFRLVFSDLHPLTVTLEETSVIARETADGRNEELTAGARVP